MLWFCCQANPGKLWNQVLSRNRRRTDVCGLLDLSMVGTCCFGNEQALIGACPSSNDHSRRQDGRERPRSLTSKGSVLKTGSGVAVRDSFAPNGKLGQELRTTYSKRSRRMNVLFVAPGATAPRTLAYVLVALANALGCGNRRSPTAVNYEFSPGQITRFVSCEKYDHVGHHRTDPTPPDRSSLYLGQIRHHHTIPTIHIPLLIPRRRDRDPGGPLVKQRDL
jgi:hypothetical protein